MRATTLTPSEDANIMYARAQLERIWNEQLSPTQQSDWTTYFSTTPPNDVAGRSYVTSTPTAFNQILVSPATQYAWSQIYGVMRFGAQPVTDPTSVTRFTLDLGGFHQDSSSFYFRVNYLGAFNSITGIIAYSTNPADNTYSSTQADLRPVGKWIPDAFPRWLEYKPAMAAKWSTLTLPQFGLSVMAIDLNNQLIWDASIQQLVVT